MLGKKTSSLSPLPLYIHTYTLFIMRWLSLVILAGLTLAEDTTTTSGTSTSIPTSYDISDASSITGDVALPLGTYVTYSSTITLNDGDTSLLAVTSSIPSNSSTATGNQTLVTHSSNSVTVLIGGGGTTTLDNRSMNATATTSATSTPTLINTRPCNGYAELCARNYSNITMVAAHNSPFSRPGNAASNQMFDVTAQLNDGVRMCKSILFPVPRSQLI